MLIHLVHDSRYFVTTIIHYLVLECVLIQKEDESDSDEDEEEMELKSGADFKDIKVKVPSLRMDALLKAGLNMSRK